MLRACETSLGEPLPPPGWQPPADGNLIPAVGQTFVSLQAAYEFYNLYSWQKGFGIRYGRSRTNQKGFRTRQDIICSCAVTNSIIFTQ